MFSVIVKWPDHAAAPQVPTFGPITTPSIPARYSGGRDGPIPECSVLEAGSSNNTDGLIDES
jgi:hypothetical protein